MDSTTSPSEPSALSIFHEDILHHILSYVADVPFELSESGGARDKVWPTDSQSTLTHTLPLVCKLFYKLSSNDMYWKVRSVIHAHLSRNLLLIPAPTLTLILIDQSALLRLIQREPNWEKGIKRVIFDAVCDELRAEMKKRNRREKRTKNRSIMEDNHMTMDTITTRLTVVSAAAMMLFCRSVNAKGNICAKV